MAAQHAPLTGEATRERRQRSTATGRRTAGCGTCSRSLASRARSCSQLLDLAQFYVRLPGDVPARDQSLAARTVANLFFEPSTRTRVSFELAARRLGADVVNLDLHTSSRSKGESVLDTIYTLQAMQADVLVIRDAEPGIPALVARHVAPHVSMLNAGEAHVSHPTQGLLDVLTIRQRKGDLGSLCVAIVGDVRHSRVARSAAQALSTLGVGEFRLVAPARAHARCGRVPGREALRRTGGGHRGRRRRS